MSALRRGANASLMAAMVAPPDSPTLPAKPFPAWGSSYSTEVDPTADQSPAAASAHSELLQVVAMCVAGFVGSGGGDRRLWQEMCGALLARPALSGAATEYFSGCSDGGDISGGSRGAYLSAICETMLSISIANSGDADPDGDTEGDNAGAAAPSRGAGAGGGAGMRSAYARVLGNGAIALADRVAFALRFLVHDELVTYTRGLVDECIASGNLEGLVLLGLGSRATPLLQAYVDLTGDVQTVALIAVRMRTPAPAPAPKLEPPAGSAGAAGSATSEQSTQEDANHIELANADQPHPSPPSSLARVHLLGWVDAYRDLLNTWQLWEARVLFDVGRRERSRRRMSGAAADGGGGGGRDSDSAAMAEAMAPPPPMRVCCQYCAAPLPLEALRASATSGATSSVGGSGSDPRARQQQQQGGSKHKYLSSWLRRQKPVLTCCPACRKPLPRCYVCLLPLSCLNPYLELQRNQMIGRASSSVSGRSSSGADNDKAASLASLPSHPFADWFTWCQRCKHGGHSHHVAQWFETNRECGVSGCSCPCSSF